MLPDTAPGNVVMLGSGGALAAVRDAILQDAGVTVRTESLVTSATGRIDNNTAAVVVVTPVTGHSTALACLALTRFFGDRKIPIFVTLPGPVPRNELSFLQSSGATSVLLWPAEREALMEAVARAAGDASPPGDEPVLLPRGPSGAARR